MNHIHEFCPCSICNRPDVIAEGIVMCWVGYCTERKNEPSNDKPTEDSGVQKGAGATALSHTEGSQLQIKTITNNKHEGHECVYNPNLKIKI